MPKQLFYQTGCTHYCLWFSFYFKSNQVKADFLSHYKDIPFLMLEDTPDDPDIPYLIADNYSELVTEQVEYILDHNPELEAIALQ